MQLSAVRQVVESHQRSLEDYVLRFKGQLVEGQDLLKALRVAVQRMRAAEKVQGGGRGRQGR